MHKNAGEALVGVKRDATMDEARNKDAKELFQVLKSLLSNQRTTLRFETSDLRRSQLEV